MHTAIMTAKEVITALRRVLLSQDLSAEFMAVNQE
jgi:uncharacterized protein (DUF1778 family)